MRLPPLRVLPGVAATPRGAGDGGRCPAEHGASGGGGDERSTIIGCSGGGDDGGTGGGAVSHDPGGGGVSGWATMLGDCVGA
jgi:hypothetical protein